MRLLKVSQRIDFRHDTFSGIFSKGEKVKFTGFINGSSDIIRGYMQQEPLQDDSLTLYVKGLREISFGEETWILLQTTKVNANPITMCSYFPFITSDTATGYLDDTNGTPSHKGRYFFTCSHYLADAHIQVEEIPMLTSNEEPNPEYEIAEKAREEMLNKMYSAKEQGPLNLGFLLDYVKPNWLGVQQKLIDTYPGSIINL